MARRVSRKTRTRRAPARRAAVRKSPARRAAERGAPAPLRREVVMPANYTPSASPLSPAIKVGNVIYCSGQTGGEAGPGVREQTHAVLSKLKQVLEAAGSSLDKVDKCLVFLTNQEDFGAMNEVYRTFFPKDPPARSTVVVAALARPGLVVEIECVAHV